MQVRHIADSGFFFASTNTWAVGTLRRRNSRHLVGLISKGQLSISGNMVTKTTGATNDDRLREIIDTRCEPYPCTLGIIKSRIP